MTLNHLSTADEFHCGRNLAVLNW